MSPTDDRKSQPDLEAAREAGVTEARWEQLKQRHEQCDRNRVVERLVTLETEANSRFRAAQQLIPIIVGLLAAAVSIWSALRHH